MTAWMASMIAICYITSLWASIVVVVEKLINRDPKLMWIHLESSFLIIEEKVFNPFLFCWKHSWRMDAVKSLKPAYSSNTFTYHHCWFKMRFWFIDSNWNFRSNTVPRLSACKLESVGKTLIEFPECGFIGNFKFFGIVHYPITLLLVHFVFCLHDPFMHTHLNLWYFKLTFLFCVCNIKKSIGIIWTHAWLTRSFFINLQERKVFSFVIKSFFSLKERLLFSFNVNSFFRRNLNRRDNCNKRKRGKFHWFL